MHVFCWSRQHQQVCHFSSLLLLCDSRSVLATLSCYLKLCGRSDRNCLLSPVLSGYHRSPDSCFSRGTTRLMGWPGGERYLRPLLSSKFFDTQVPSISTEELVLPRHARCVLPRLRCNGHSFLLGSYLSRIGRIENPFCSACGHLSSHSALSSYGLCAAHSLATFCLFTTSGPEPGELPGFWASMVFRHAPIPRKGSVNQQQKQQVLKS